MERYIKISFVLIFACSSLLSNAWAIIFGVALFLSCIGTLSSKYYFAITIPIFYLLVAYVGQSYTGILISAIGIYVFRCVIEDNTYNNCCWFVFFSLILLGVFVFLRYMYPIPLLLMLSTLPVKKINIVPIKKKPMCLSTIIFIALSLVYITYGYKTVNKKAYLQHGVWAKPHPQYSINKLNNASCYSYSEFVTLLNADTISDLHSINNYDELWIVTPTKPFTSNQLSIIKKWVLKGGRLIVVSDHTDLYGHARCTNQISSTFGCKIHNSATFDNNNKLIFNDAYASPINIKTGTNMTGFAFPLASSWLWEEEAYYANTNFFGPLVASGEDSFGEKLIAGQVVYGLGQVSFLQDSTIFANFAVYQPYVLKLADLISCHSFITRLFFLVPFLFAFCLLAYSSGFKRVFTMMFFVFPFTLPISDCPAFNYGINPQIWTGNYKYVLENGCPYTNISTAYSQAAFSGRKPLWVNNVNLKEKDVIWVDTITPPCKEWRWIKVQDVHEHRDSFNSPFDSLYTYLETPFIRSWAQIYSNYYKLNANSLFSDNVMNDWWYNEGISRNRMNRIRAWIAWLNKTTYITENYQTKFSNDLKKAIVHTKDNHRIMINIPKPFGITEQEVYLGNGLSGIIYIHNDTLSIFGKKQYCENINCPELWTIDYIE